MLNMKNNWMRYSILGLLIFVSTGVFAHVKWFSSFDFLDQSISIKEVINPTYWGLCLLSVVVVSLLIILDKKMKQTNWNKRINSWLNERQKYALDVMRIAMFAVLIISWMNDTILTPDLKASTSMVGWFEFVIAILLLIPATVSLSGLLLIGLYVFCIFEFGFFYMLDYLHFLGIGIYFLTIRSKNRKISAIGMPALYITLGFALIWLAYEKLFYPAWSMYLLEEHPQLALGFPHKFFLQGAAFVEIGLGFMLLFGAMERPLAAVITLVFILTSMVFGKTEIIGHTSLHAMLIVFILKGTGDFYRPPIERVHSVPKKIGVAVVSYMLVTTLVLFSYKAIANHQYEVAKAKATDISADMKEHNKRMLDVSTMPNQPRIVKMEVLEEPEDMGYDIYVEMENWTFTPENVGKPYTENEGHIHVYVDGKKAGRMYSNWFYLGKLSKGKHRIALTINGDDHTAFTIGNKMIGAEKEVYVK